MNLNKYIFPSDVEKSGIFDSYIITKMYDELYIINSKTSLDVLKENEIIKLKKENIIDCFDLRDTYKVNNYLTNHFVSVYYVLDNGEIVIFGNVSSEDKAKFLLNFGTRKEL